MKFDPMIVISRKSKRLEIALVSLVSIFFVIFFHKVFLGQVNFTHDSIRWYGVFHFFADSILQGVFPYWNPYEFCGQPFYYNLGILRIYEPITLGSIALQKVFNASLLDIFHWEYMMRIWLVAVGTYLCYRQVSKFVLSNALVFAVVLFSSFTMTSMRQNGFLYVIFWTPWFMYFFLRALKKFDTYNVIGCAFFAGLSLSSYQGIYFITFFFIFLLTFLINMREWLISVCLRPGNLVRILAGVIIALALAAPLLATYVDSSKVVPVARLDDKAVIDSGIKLSYDSIRTAGTHSRPTDLLELAFPALVNCYYWPRFQKEVLMISECFLYIGIIPFILALMGIFGPKKEYGLNFLITLICVGLLMMGPVGKFHTLLYWTFFPIRLTRHMHLFSAFFIFTLFYFVGKGSDLFLNKVQERQAGRVKA